MLNLDPSEILLVASHKYDLKAARACGFKTAYIFRPLEFGTLREEQIPHENEFDFITTAISELPAMLNPSPAATNISRPYNYNYSATKHLKRFSLPVSGCLFNCSTR